MNYTNPLESNVKNGNIYLPREYEGLRLSFQKVFGTQERSVPNENNHNALKRSIEDGIFIHYLVNAPYSYGLPPSSA